MKLIAGLIGAAGLWTAAAQGQAPVTLTIDAQRAGAAIPENFVGLSFGMKSLLPKESGARFFSATNKSLIALFQNLGLKHLRVGGTSVESPPDTAIPDEKDIDNLFAFARAAGVTQIIYSLRLLETDPGRPYEATDAAIARYIWKHYRRQLDCFAIGNEPDRKKVFDKDLTITNLTTYLDQWQKFAKAVTHAAPGAKFTGPDGASVHWTAPFAGAEKNSGLIASIAQHYYVGGAGRDVEAGKGIEAMLSPQWIEANEKMHQEVTKPVLADGLPFRFTEANDHYSGGVRNASDTFAGALWALDFLHWWAAHDAVGVDFHNTQWVVNDIISHDADGRLMINPKGYGLKTFDLGGHGSIASISMANPQGINLTAYAVRQKGNFFVTIINKDYGATARAADVTIVLEGMAKHVEAIYLTAPNGDVATKTGVTLGGASIGSNDRWRGKWTRLAADKTGHCVVKVAAASAAVVKIPME